jgi:hypothetical protein
MFAETFGAKWAASLQLRVLMAAVVAEIADKLRQSWTDSIATRH